MLPSVPRARSRGLGDARVSQSVGAAGGSRWRTLFTRRAPPSPVLSDEAVRGYVQVALDLLARCEELHERWLVALDEQRRNERLANAAAVYRWQLTAVLARLEALPVPSTLQAWHDALLEALGAASRGTHLLSHGYRFHVVRTICDGGLLLEEAREQQQALRDVLQSAVSLSVGAA
jgi:hypothetical protein